MFQQGRSSASVSQALLNGPKILIRRFHQRGGTAAEAKIRVLPRLRIPPIHYLAQHLSSVEEADQFW